MSNVFVSFSSDWWRTHVWKIRCSSSKSIRSLGDPVTVSDARTPPGPSEAGHRGSAGRNAQLIPKRAGGSSETRASITPADNQPAGPFPRSAEALGVLSGSMKECRRPFIPGVEVSKVSEVFRVLAGIGKHFRDPSIPEREHQDPTDWTPRLKPFLFLWAAL